MPVKKKRKSSGPAAAAADDTGLKKCKLGRYRLAAGLCGPGWARGGCRLYVPGERRRGWAAPPQTWGGPSAPAPLRPAPAARGLRHPFVRRPRGLACLGFAAVGTVWGPAGTAPRLGRTGGPVLWHVPGPGWAGVGPSSCASQRLACSCSGEKRYGAAAVPGWSGLSLYRQGRFQRLSPRSF